MTVTVTNTMSRVYAFGEKARLIPGVPTTIENPADLAELQRNPIIQKYIEAGDLKVDGDLGGTPSTPSPADPTAELEALKAKVAEAEAARDKAIAEKTEADAAAAKATEDAKTADEARQKAEAEAAKAKAGKDK